MMHLHITPVSGSKNHAPSIVYFLHVHLLCKFGALLVMDTAQNIFVEENLVQASIALIIYILAEIYKLTGICSRTVSDKTGQVS